VVLVVAWRLGEGGCLRNFGEKFYWIGSYGFWCLETWTGLDLVLVLVLACVKLIQPAKAQSGVCPLS
jgi:hypothetical protein